MISEQIEPKLFLLDAYALIYRGYYAFIKNPRINSKGLNTSAIMGFTNALIEVLRNEQPSHIGVCFDVGKTFRHDSYPEYKAHREETPEAIKIAVPYIYKILEALNIPALFKEGFEADDVIGTLAHKAEKEGFNVYMMTPDKDFTQLVTEKVKMFKPSRGGNPAEVWGIQEVKEKMGVEHPLQVIDLLGMMGDSADNIPGLKGIGPKTAQKFIAKYGSMENLLDNTHELKGKQKEKVEETAELGRISKELARISLDVDIDFKAEDLKLQGINLPDIQILFQELEFRRMLDIICKIYRVSPPKIQIVEPEIDLPKSEPGGQLSLFDTAGNLPEAEVEKPYRNIENRKHLYQIINSDLAYRLLRDKLEIQKIVSCHFYYDNENAIDALILGVAFCWDNTKAYYLPLEGDLEAQKKTLEPFRAFFESTENTKIIQDFKFAIKAFTKYEINIKGDKFDTMIAHYLIHADAKHELNIVSENYLNYQVLNIIDLIGKKGKKQLKFQELSLEQQASYLGERADILFKLKEFFESKLDTENKKLFQEVEMPLMEVLAKMELEGIALDVDSLADLSQELTQEIAVLEKNIYELAGEEAFNIASPKQLGLILFDKLKLDPKAKKTKTGQYKTGEEILSKLASKHDIVAKILEFRQLSKLKSTYVDALPKEVHAQSKRVHTSFGQTVAATGRLSSVNPNLQNIPIRTKRGQQVRKAFIARDENHVLLAADYSQIELRLIAEISQDDAMTEAFLKDEDIHAATAASIFNVELSEVTREQRSQAKTVNFGIIYGVSSFGLAEQTSLSRKEAKALISSYYETYPSLKTFMDNQVAVAREKEYVETLLGRKRYLKDINSNNGIVRSHAERNAVNAPIQGSAADIIKIAMVNIQAKLEADNYQTKMLLQVHDELVFDVPKEELDKVSEMIKYEMENAIATKIPLKVEIDTGNNWLAAH